MLPLGIMLAIATATGWAAARLARCGWTGLVAGVLALAAMGGWYAYAMAELAYGDPTTNGPYVRLMGELGWFGALVFHAALPAALLVPARRALGFGRVQA